MTAPDPVHAAVASLVDDVLAHAGRCLAVLAWPAPSPPESTPDVPVIEVQRGDDDVPAVFAFATVVADDAAGLSPLEIRRADVGDDSVVVGDEVGLEIPLRRVAPLAHALLHLHLTRDVGDDAFVPLPTALQEALRESGRVDAVLFTLAALTATLTPPTTALLSHLSTLASLDEARCRAVVRVAGDDDDARPELLILMVDDGVARLLPVEAVAGEATVRALAAALPPPPPSSTTTLWHRLARPDAWGGPVHSVRWQAGVVGVEVGPTELLLTLRLGLLDDGVEIDAREARCALPVPPLLLRVAIDDDGAARARESAVRFLRRTLVAAESIRLPPERLLDGSAWARVVARAGAGLALEPRGNTALDVSAMDDEGRVTVDVDGAVLMLSPADDAILVPGSDAGFSPAFAAGRSIDGDDEAARAVALTLATAVAGGDADLELVLVDDDGSERELRLSTWLRDLADRPHAGVLAPAAATRAAWADVTLALLDER